MLVKKLSVDSPDDRLCYSPHKSDRCAPFVLILLRAVSENTDLKTRGSSVGTVTAMCYALAACRRPIERARGFSLLACLRRFLFLLICVVVVDTFGALLLYLG